jgi:hypothetical protein
MMDDDHAVTREVHVQLDAVGAKRQSVVERRNGVLGPQRRAAAVRKDQRHAGL